MNDNFLIYNGDCLDLLKELDDESIDCVVTDCPYHIVSGGCSNIPRKDEPKGIFNRRSTFTQKMLKVVNCLIVMILNLKNGCQMYIEY